MRLEYQYRCDGMGHLHRCGEGAWYPSSWMSFDGSRMTWLGPFSARERDLLRVMAAVLAVDRLSPRQSQIAGCSDRELPWQRRLMLRIAVECPELWTQTGPHLVRLLSFMTDDAWELEFDGTVEKSAHQQLLPVERQQELTKVALFSGGLDSVAGLLAEHQSSGGNFVAVSACGNEVRGAAQKVALTRLRAHGVPVNWLKLNHQLRGAHLPRARMESSQRSRGLLFLAMGAAVASLLQRDAYSVYETGIGCINLPISTAQVGAQGTRAMHPRTLALFNEIVERVLGRPVRAIAPFFLHTKGELCRLAGTALGALAGASMSCDEGEGHKADAMLHCGLCTSCLFRRVALHAAGLVPDTTNYRDITTKRHGAYELSAFESQASRLRLCRQFADLVDLDPDARFSTVIPFVSPPEHRAAETSVFEMYQRYAAELQAYFHSARPTLKHRARQPQKERERDLFSATG